MRCAPVTEPPANRDTAQTGPCAGSSLASRSPARFRVSAAGTRAAYGGPARIAYRVSSGHPAGRQARGSSNRISAQIRPARPENPQVTASSRSMSGDREPAQVRTGDVPAELEDARTSCIRSWRADTGQHLGRPRLERCRSRSRGPLPSPADRQPPVSRSRCVSDRPAAPPCN